MTEQRPADRPADELLSSETVDRGTAGGHVVHALASAPSDHHLRQRLVELDAAFSGLLSHQQKLLMKQIEAASTPEFRQRVKHASEEVALGVTGNALFSAIVWVFENLPSD